MKLIEEILSHRYNLVEFSSARDRVRKTVQDNSTALQFYFTTHTRRVLLIFCLLFLFYLEQVTSVQISQCIQQSPDLQRHTLYGNYTIKSPICKYKTSTPLKQMLLGYNPGSIYICLVKCIISRSKMIFQSTRSWYVDFM